MCETITTKYKSCLLGHGTMHCDKWGGKPFSRLNLIISLLGGCSKRRRRPYQQRSTIMDIWEGGKLDSTKRALQKGP